MLQSALYYAEKYNFSVLPLHGINLETKKCTCGKPECSTPDYRGKATAGKHPWTANGLKNASSDPAVLANLFSSRHYANIGIATGPISGIFVLDVDGVEGESSLSHYPPLPHTLTSTTGNGRHMVFAYPDDMKVYTRAGKFDSGLDIRGEGGYIVAPPSVHFNGAVYEWLDDEAPIAQAPAWLLEIVCKPPAERVYETYTPPAHSDTAEWTTDQVRDLLSYIDPDCGYDDWIQIGMALHDAGYSLAVWDEWSKRGSKYKPGVTIPHWKSFRGGGGISFGTVVHMAQLSGWKPPETEADLSLDDHPAKEFLLRIKREWEQSDNPETGIPISPQLFDPLKIPGLVGDTVRAIIETSQKPQPELALLNTLAALGAVFGRRYASPMETRTNIYTVGIAVTAAGKDHSRRFIKRLMIDAGLETFIGGDTIISGAGLLTAVEKQPAQVMHLDEFGMLLEAITDARGASHMKAASKVITEMYSTSAMTYISGQYADRKTDPVKIPFPNLCIYGTTTPEKYIASMNKTVIASGELNRFIVIRPTVDRPERRRYMGGAIPSEQLVASWKALLPAAPVLNNALIVLETINVSWAPLEERVWQLGLYEDKMIGASDTGALWGRYRENVIKVAMIFAICRNPLVPIINDADFDLAEAIIQQAIFYIQEVAINHIADSQHEKDCNDVLSAVKKAGGRISKTQLAKTTKRMDAKQRDNSLKSLMEQNAISVEQRNTHEGAGRPVIWYIAN